MTKIEPTKSKIAILVESTLGPVMGPKVKDTIKITFGTDFHFGSKRTPAWMTLRGVKEAWPDTPYMAQYDLFIIGGDWMDRLLALAERDVYEAQEACIYILYICAKYKIKLRIVEGTCSHDRKQSIMFTEFNERLNIGCDLGYFQELAIEYIEDLDFTILYLPDEWHHDCGETLRQAKELIAKHGYVRVDVAVVHGGFKFQFPLELPSLHDEVAWSELVNYCILSGHIHTRGRCLNVICGGSFNRNTHDEDGPKGHVDVTIYKGKLKSVDFIDNKYAKVFKTINIFDMQIDDVIIEVENLGKLHNGAAVRLEYREGDPIKAIRDILEVMYPKYIWTDIKRVDKSKKPLTRLFSNRTFQPVDITRTSVLGIILDRMIAKGETTDTLDTVKKVINETIKETEWNG